MLSNQTRFAVLLRNAFAFAAVAGTAVAVANAQQTVVASNDSPLFAVNARPMDLAQFAGVDYASSSSSTDAALPADPASLSGTAAAGMQPPPRRRYGRPRYNDSSHNADGSNKYTFVAAVGFELPVANTYHYFNTSYAFQVGGGRQFNKKLAVLAQFDYDKFGVNGATLTNQGTIYNNYLQAGISGLDANNHIWSFTLNPKYSFYESEKYGAYVVGGLGFYHKVTNFTAPQQGQYYDPYYGYVSYVANANFDHYTSNAPGFNAGFGMTYKFSRFADERFFIEGRYVFIDNSQRQGLTVSDATTPPYGTPQSGPGGTYTGTNFFPANSNRTTYIPIKVGVRF